MSITLYIHIPFCAKKCPYCDFYSICNLTPELESIYINTLIEDLKQQLPLLNNRKIKSIFIGGGTPSLLSTNSFHKLFNFIHTNLQLTNDVEITTEANPGTIDLAKLKDLKSIGINRLSLGVQSFNNKLLHNLGRIHDASDCKKAIDAIKTSGFDNFNIDIMHGLPNQTIDDALTDIKTACNLGPSHLSWYQLTIEPDTTFGKTKPTLPNEKTLDIIEQEGKLLLKDDGFNQYEISAYTKNQPCIHNLSYWQFGDYLAIGAASHGKVTINNEIFRFNHPKDVNKYISKPKLDLIKLDKDAIILEFMLGALRLNNGFSPKLFNDKTGFDLSIIKPSLILTKEKGLLTITHDNIKPSKLGFKYLDDLLTMISC